MENKDFFAIRSDCNKKGILFEDPEFHPDNRSLPSVTFSGKPILVDKWMRPKEICSNPKFFVDGFSRLDIKQGSLGDCWFLAAVTNLTLDRVVCKSNSFDEYYAGIFHF